MNPRRPVYILGISAQYHDSAACLLRDGDVVAAAQEERFTRKRHDAAFPTNAIEYCLREAGVERSALDHVCFYDKPVRKLARILETHVAMAPWSLRSFLLAMPIWVREKLWVAADLQDALEHTGEVLFTEHHLAHAASAFYPSPFARAAVLTLDGVGEWATASAGIGDGRTLELHREIRFPHSLGLLYSAFTYFTGFRVNSGEYKLMGLAPYGTPRYVDVIRRELIDIRDDGSFHLNMDYFEYVSGLRMTNRRFARLFDGPPRKPESPLTQREMDLAASVQAVTEDVVVRLCRDLHQRTGMTDLCLAGGVALNCVANGKILSNGTGFERLFVQPAAGDAGGALGCALAAWHGLLEQPRAVDGRRDAMQGALLGPDFDASAVETALSRHGARYARMARNELNVHVAALLDAGKAVGWFQGRMEFGPRALGARSILADARNPEMQRTLNLKIKQRESFRPFAPAVLAEYAHEWFDLTGESPYMLITVPVHPRHRYAEDPDSIARTGLDRLGVRRSSIPAVTHVDGSARVQTVDADRNPRFHALLSAFYARTGCPLVVNTSFNVRGEPIVCTPDEAYRCFMRTELDVLVIEDFVLHKHEQPRWGETPEQWRGSMPLD